MDAKSRKRGLGMGLSALLATDLGDEQAPTSSKAYNANYPVASLVPSPYQPRRRFDDEELNSLADSIRSQGILQPLVLRVSQADPEMYEIIAGERRWRAAQLAGLHEVPAIVKEFDDQTVLEIALIENLQRADLNAIEEAMAFQKLIDEFGHSQEKVAKAVGKSRPHIANTLRLLKLPAEVQEMVSSGLLSAGHARAVLTCDDPLTMAKAIAERGLNVRDAEALAAARDKVVKAGLPEQKPTRDSNIIALEHQLKERLGLRVDIKPDRKGGKIAIHYREASQLEFVLDRLLSHAG